MSNAEVLPFLKQNQRLIAPPNCPPEINQLMLQCWAERAKERPDFAHLKRELIALTGHTEAHYEKNFSRKTAGDDTMNGSVYQQPAPANSSSGGGGGGGKRVN